MPLSLVTLTAMLAAFWLLLSGHWSPLLLGLGTASVLLVLVLVRRMGRVDGLPYPVRTITPRLVAYWGWLAWQVLKSNVDVVRRIWHPDMPIDPLRVTVPLPQRTLLGRTLYANSITLTPGTVTIAVGRSDLEIHALTPEFAAQLSDGEMARRVSKLDRRDH